MSAQPLYQEILVPVATFVGILVATWIVAYFISSLLGRVLSSSPPLVAVQVRRVAWLFTWLVGALIALEQAVRVDILLVLVGLFGAAIILANKDTLQNLGSKYFHEVYVPFKIGDSIRIHQYTGRVIEINPITTVLITDKEELISVPNALFLREVVENITPHAWKEVLVPIAVGNDINLAEFESEVMKTCNKMRLHLDSRFPPILSIKNRGDKTTELLLTLMVKRPDKKESIVSEINTKIPEIISQVKHQKK